MPSWRDQVALVTGASSGTGRPSALAFAREEARVAAADLLGDDGEDTVRMIRDRGGEAVFVRTDVSRSAGVAKLIGRALEAYGRLDLAFHNPGVEGDMDTTSGISLTCSSRAP